MLRRWKFCRTIPLANISGKSWDMTIRWQASNRRRKIGSRMQMRSCIPDRNKSMQKKYAGTKPEAGAVPAYFFLPDP